MKFLEETSERYAAQDGMPGISEVAPAAPGAPVQVYLVAQPLVGWGLQRMVQTAGPRFQLAGVSSRIEEALPILERSLPDVVVLDFDDGYGVEDLRDAYHAMRAKVLVLTGVTDPGFLTQLLNAGATGVLQKREAPAALLRAIDSVGAGRVFATEAATDRLFEVAARSAARRQDGDASRIASLTLRERQTIAAVTSDASAPVKVIAGRLCISEHTLRNHLTSIYSKLGVTGRLALHAYADQHALKGTAARMGRDAR